MSWEDFYKEIQETHHIEDEATVIKVPLDDVREITSEAIFYKKGYLDTKKIDLNECTRNFYLAQGISPLLVRSICVKHWVVAIHKQHR